MYYYLIFKRIRRSSISVNSMKIIREAPPESSEVTQFSNECYIQVLRSMCKWSGNTYTETSILQAYIDLIQNAQHFIYIENQVILLKKKIS